MDAVPTNSGLDSVWQAAVWLGALYSVRMGTPLHLHCRRRFFANVVDRGEPLEILRRRINQSGKVVSHMEQAWIQYLKYKKAVPWRGP